VANDLFKIIPPRKRNPQRIGLHHCRNQVLSNAHAVISKVPASNINQGYQNLADERIVTVNGRRIRNRHQLIAAVANSNEDS
jgi:hypothetical protein